MTAYVALGLDAARFWGVTPRLLKLEMDGAEARLRRDRELTWWGAMLPHLKKPVPLEKFMGQKVDPATRAAAFNAAWDRVDRAFNRKGRSQP
ncbi:hypothetical protein [Falsirhodobacter halotolerans]|uniref:hypothetical protein n=1 Tax=Falsirhodobacter halotolerans TaxID=1146892 RepID=UPI001FD1C9B7|nr:hypothetical protein [Falsirhodobacter halotolerans]MCJ8138434.1 hypothetical protein [Falsirhodobacter halotolerans]